MPAAAFGGRGAEPGAQQAPPEGSRYARACVGASRSARLAPTVLLGEASVSDARCGGYCRPIEPSDLAEGRHPRGSADSAWQQPPTLHGCRRLSPGRCSEEVTGSAESSCVSFDPSLRLSGVADQPLDVQVRAAASSRLGSRVPECRCWSPREQSGSLGAGCGDEHASAPRRRRRAPRLPSSPPGRS